jgi:hypothetical protein
MGLLIQKSFGINARKQDDKHDNLHEGRLYKNKKGK